MGNSPSQMLVRGQYREEEVTQGQEKQQEPWAASSLPLALQGLHVTVCWKVHPMSRVFSWDLPGIS